MCPISFGRMTGERSFLRCERASAATEMALVLPLLITLMFGGLEASSYLWNQHKVVKAVRDGARFAGRQAFGAFTCGGSDLVDQNGVTNATVLGRIKDVTRTGTVDGTGVPAVPGWTNAQVTVTSRACDAANTQTGIFADQTSGAYRIRVSATVPYRPLFSQLGFSTSTIGLSASSEAVVMGL